MAHLAILDQAREDEAIAGEQLGSVLKTVGGVFLGMALILSMFDFVDVREGTNLMIIVSGVLGTVGLVLIFLGQWKRAEPV